jgi:hypothetical protein
VIYRNARGITLIKVLGILLPLLLVLPAAAQEPAAVQEDESAESVDAHPIVEPSAKPAAAAYYEPDSRRDPFLNIVPVKTAQKVFVDEEVPRGDPPPGIAGTFIDAAGLEGIVIRSDNRRTAIIRGADNRAYFLREGDRIFDGYLQTIENDSVIFVRETLMRSGRVLTQEVTKRLRKS